MTRAASQVGISSRPKETQRRILAAALSIFGEQGYPKASTRAIAARAQVNAASIHYHFGDKVGLYRAVFQQIFRTDRRTGAETASFETVLRIRAREIIVSYHEESTKKLLAREQLEPTGLLGAQLFGLIRLSHEWLINALTRDLALLRPDDDVHRLALCCVGMAAVFSKGRTAIERLAPGIMKGDDAVEVLLDRIVNFGRAIVEAERARRAALLKSK